MTDATVETYVAEIAASMSEDDLDRFTEYGSPACACLGAPEELWHLEDANSSVPCRCQLYLMAYELRRGPR